MRLPARPGASTHLQRGGHGLVPVHGRADAQVPRDADGVGRHGEALEHNGILPLTAVLPGEASNLQHRGREESDPGSALPWVCRGLPQGWSPNTPAHRQAENALQPPQKAKPSLPLLSQTPNPTSLRAFQDLPIRKQLQPPIPCAFFPKPCSQADVSNTSQVSLEMPGVQMS